MLETIKERKKYIQGLSDSELDKYLKDLYEHSTKLNDEVHQIRKEFDRLGIELHYFIEPNLSALEVNQLLVELIFEEQDKRAETAVKKRKNLADFTDKNAKFRKDMEKYTQYAPKGKITSFPFEPYNNISTSSNSEPLTPSEEEK